MLFLPFAVNMQATKTGPKGVLADYSLHKAELEEQRERKEREIKDMMEKQAVNFKEEVDKHFHHPNLHRISLYNDPSCLLF